MKLHVSDCFFSGTQSCTIALMSGQKIIAFVGMSGAGKSVCVNYLAEKYGWPVVHFGSMVYEEVQRRGLDNVRDEIPVREDMRAKEGAAVLAKHASKKADKYISEGAETVLFDGLYSWSEYKHLAERYGENLTTVAVLTPKVLRRQRVLEREDEHRKYTLEQLIRREVAEIENLEKGGPIAYADYMLVNDGTIDDLTAKLENVISEVA